MRDSDIHTIKIYQDEYFDILMEFFVGATGKSPEKFCELNRFSEAVREMGERYRGDGARIQSSYNSYVKLEERLRHLYTNESLKGFKAAKQIECCKVHLGGSSRFYETQLNATRKSILFSDIVLVPDPVMPWLETEREHEKFKMVEILQAAYYILHLKDFLSEEFEIPPIFVFPSFEKSLETRDELTIASSKQLFADVLSFYVDNGIKLFEDVVDYVKFNDREFLSKVETSNLFIPPGGEIGTPLKEAIQTYKNEARTWRTDEFNKSLDSTPDSFVVLNGIFERIQPQFHVFENSYELKSNPLLCIDAQAHYFRLIGNMTNKRVFNIDHTDNKTLSILSAITSRRLDFLSNINNEQMVFLRKTKENIEFRSNLRSFINNLPKTIIDDLPNVASEICSQIELLISKHERQVDTLNRKFAAKHNYTALMTGGALAVSMMPALAPFLGAAVPIALTAGGKYIANKLEERHERRILSGSMMGVFALAKNNDN